MARLPRCGAVGAATAILACWSLLLIGPAAARVGQRDRPDRDLQQHQTQPRRHVLIGYEHRNAPKHLGSILSHPFDDTSALSKVNAVRAFVSKDEMQALRDSPLVKYVEEDSLVYPYNYVDDSTGEEFPYGLIMTQADIPLIRPWPKRTATTTSSACSDPSSFKVAVIDSGLEALHPDSPCRLPLNDTDTNCVGKSFDLPPEDLWYAPISAHGTHVVGTSKYNCRTAARALHLYRTVSVKNIQVAKNLPDSFY